MSENEDTTMSSATKEPEQVVEKETTVSNALPEFVEINDSFDSIEIDNVLETIAKTNELPVTWKELQPKLESLISKQYKALEEKLTDEQTKKAADDLIMKITHSINDHLNCPFTIQRLCELIIEPKKYYKVYIKYLRAVEKVLLVTSYWEDYQKPENTSENMETDTTENKLFNTTTKTFELEPHNFGGDAEEQEDTAIETKDAAETKADENNKMEENGAEKPANSDMELD